ncbi:hypothetical protein [Enterobacter phage 01_vB_Eclo_IJM]|nr:hypothetical protein [Enterobacter phage 01_vB_Eclo_IJM]
MAQYSGTFLGGYIGSWANGIKVQRGCRGILILNDMYPVLTLAVLV